MSNTLSFSFEDTSLTILGDILNPLFIAKQVCEILGFTNPRKAIVDHCDSDDVIKQVIDTNGGKQEVNCVNESGLYALIFGSKLPTAKRFKRWVTSEVLPAIRKTGLYDNSVHLTPAQQLKLRNAVAGRAHRKPENYQKIYRELKAHFQVAKYNQIPQASFDEALEVIDGIELLPEALHQKKEPKEPTFLVTQDFLERLRNFVYYWRYYYREDLERIYTIMSALDSPHASRLNDAIKNLNLAILESNLENLGFPVKDLRCYKALMLKRNR